MTQAKAQSVASNLIAAGYNPQVLQQGANWLVYVTANGGQVDVSAIQTFATNNGVTGKADSVVFV